MSFRPEIVECWVFRVREDDAADGPRMRDEPDASEPRTRLEFLLIRRAPGRIYAGLWQCVTGAVEEGERVPLAVLREVAEETGLGPSDIEAFYDLDQVSSFYDERRDEVVSSVIFAARVRSDAVAVTSHEHDGAEWVTPDEAVRRSIWPSYRDSIARIRAIVEDGERARYAAVGLDGRRLAR